MRKRVVPYFSLFMESDGIVGITGITGITGIINKC